MPIQLSQLGIPDEEVRQFQPFIRLYSKGKVILQEGEQTEPRIFLLRAGVVEVSKKVGDRQEVLCQIEAVNFFGEIGAVVARPRTATITAVSDPAVVYAFDNPNLPAMLANSKWGILIMRQLAETASRLNDQSEQMNFQIEQLSKKNQQMQLQIEQLTAKYEQTQLLTERLRTIIGDILGLFQKLHQAAGNDEALRQQFLEALPKLIAFRAKELKVEPLADSHKIADYRQQGLLPDPLFQATKRPTPPKP